MIPVKISRIKGFSKAKSSLIMCCFTSHSWRHNRCETFSSLTFNIRKTKTLSRTFRLFGKVIIAARECIQRLILDAYGFRAGKDLQRATTGPAATNCVLYSTSILYLIVDDVLNRENSQITSNITAEYILRRVRFFFFNSTENKLNPIFFSRKRAISWNVWSTQKENVYIRDDVCYVMTTCFRLMFCLLLYNG